MHTRSPRARIIQVKLRVPHARLVKVAERNTKRLTGRKRF